MVLAGEGQGRRGEEAVFERISERGTSGVVSFQGVETPRREAWRHRRSWHVLEKPGAQLEGLESMIGAKN